MLRLVAANLNYSSWTIRAWLALRLAGAEFKLHDVGLKTKEGWKDRILQFSGAGKVPVLIDGSLSIHEALAICEYVAERFPAAKLWPAATEIRARARAISCEMSSNFHAIRAQLPVNVRGVAADFALSDEVRGEIARVNDIWTASLQTGPGPFLFGSQLTIADCMYVPVVSRFRTYGVATDAFLSTESLAYIETVWAHELVEELRRVSADAEPIDDFDRLLGDG